ncbi:MAG: hypothetical protein GX638_11870 [Crenarchaeota archaeon]|nr:hypothetical protein [Thermoproteota archaeon]
MALKTMYAPQKDSPSVFLMGDITPSDTLIMVSNSSVLPQAVPFPLTIGIDRTITETVIVTAIGANNQLTVTRGSGAISWTSGVQAARVFTSQDLLDVQDNIRSIDTTVGGFQTAIDANTNDIAALEITVGDTNSGLVKGLVDEITRATTAETTEKNRAMGVEGTLNTNKVNRSELAQVITNVTYSADGTELTVEFTRYNASTQQTSTFERTLPVVSSDAVGIMTPEAYDEIAALRNDVTALQQQGGRFIGISFATKAHLDAYTIPSTVKGGDFTYVIDDETKSDATTRYIYNATNLAFEFAYVIDYDPVGIASTTQTGLVKSSVTTGNDGKVYVETDGTMSVIGWSTLNNTLQNHDHNTAYAAKTHATTHKSGGADALTPTDIGAAAATHDHGTTYAAKTHATTHKSGGADALTPTDIGAAAATHKHSGYAEVLIFSNINLAASSWSSDSTYPSFPYAAVISCSGVTTNHAPSVAFSNAEAISGNFAPVALSGSETIKIYAAVAPSAAITIPSITCVKAVS